MLSFFFSFVTFHIMILHRKPTNDLDTDLGSSYAAEDEEAEMLDDMVD